MIQATPDNFAVSEEAKAWLRDQIAQGIREARPAADDEHPALAQLEADLAQRDAEIERLRRVIRVARERLLANPPREPARAELLAERTDALLYACREVGPLLTPDQRARVIEAFRRDLGLTYYGELAAAIGGAA